ncbi:hypothetical protein DL93DRAFT_2091200 [Clavulina sp. PMI_390]|nr:hypothetical protein DL93DRAFT_2091200 [Clavulina sp. PMI_390]
MVIFVDSSRSRPKRKPRGSGSDSSSKGSHPRERPKAIIIVRDTHITGKAGRSGLSKKRPRKKKSKSVQSWDHKSKTNHHNSKPARDGDRPLHNALLSHAEHLVMEYVSELLFLNFSDSQVLGMSSMAFCCAVLRSPVTLRAHTFSQLNCPIQRQDTGSLLSILIAQCLGTLPS